MYFFLHSNKYQLALISKMSVCSLDMDNNDRQMDTVVVMGDTNNIAIISKLC